MVIFRDQSTEKTEQSLFIGLFQVNRSPSFGTDSKLDYDIKSGLLRDAIKLLNIRYEIRSVLVLVSE